MSSDANFASVPRTEAVALTVANTDRTGATSVGMVDLVVPGASGSRVDDILIAATGNTTAGAVAFFLDTGGSAKLLFEIIVPAITVSAAVSPFMASLRDLGITLAPGKKLRVASRTADQIHVSVTKAGDF